MRGIFPYLRPYVPRMTVGVISKFLGTITELLIPWMLSYILDNIVPLKDTRRVLIWGVYMTICAILALVMNIYANRVASSVARDTPARCGTTCLKRFRICPAGRSTTSPSRRWSPA